MGKHTEVTCTWHGDKAHIASAVRVAQIGVGAYTRRSVSQSSARSVNGHADLRVPRIDLIRSAALRHFAIHGYDAASMRQIGAEAGITIATCIPLLHQGAAAP